MPLSAAKLESNKNKILKVAEDVFLHKKIKFKAGEHCEWCPAKGICPTKNQQLANESGLALIRKDSPLPKVETLSDEQIGKLLTYKDEITDFLKAVYSHALRRFKSSKPVAGFKVVEGTSKRKWKKEEDEIADGLKKLGLKEPHRRQDPELRTITDIEKELQKLNGGGKKGKEVAETILQNFTDYGTIPQILVPESDSRPGIKSYRELSDE